jgi:hypothetical protein
MGAVTEEDSDSLFGSDDEDEGKKPLKMPGQAIEAVRPSPLQYPGCCCRCRLR